MDKDALQATNHTCRISDKRLIRIVIALLTLMILFSCWHYCWYRYHILTDLVRESRCETMEVECRLELSIAYKEDELARLRPPDINTDIIKDGAK